MYQVMACVDAQGSPATVCDGAVWAARTLGGPLTFLHVLDRHPETTAHTDFSGQIGLGAQEDLLQELAELDARRSALAQTHGRQILDGLVERAAAAGLAPVHSRQRHGELVETVVELAADARLLVMGRHAHPAWGQRHHLDHHLERVIRAVNRPVFVTPGEQFAAPAAFALAWDGSEASRQLVDQVAGDALLRGLRCHLVHAGATDAGLQAALAEAAGRLQAAGFTVEAVSVEGDVAPALSGFVSERQLGMLVMGAFGHSRIRQWVLGSTTATLLRTSAVPVLVLR